MDAYIYSKDPEPFEGSRADLLHRLRNPDFDELSCSGRHSFHRLWLCRFEDVQGGSTKSRAVRHFQSQRRCISADFITSTPRHIFLGEKAPWVRLPEDGAKRFETMQSAKKFGLE